MTGKTILSIEQERINVDKQLREQAERFRTKQERREIKRIGKTAYQRKQNIAAVKKLLTGLKDHLHTLENREIYILFQQHDLTNLPKNVGGDLVQRLLGPGLPVDDITDWIDSNEPEPPPPTATPTPEPPENPDPPTAPNAGDDWGTTTPPTTPEPPEPPTGGEGDDGKPDLPTPSVTDALKLLNAPAWATDDAEAAESLICSALDKAWAHAYVDEAEALDEIRSFQGNAWTDEVRRRFLDTYHRATELELPANYKFQHQPYLMQRVVAAEATSRRRLLVLSGMGTGKTLAGLLATQAAGSKLTWIVVPNNNIDQWQQDISNTFAGIEVARKTLTPAWRSNGTKAVIINYEHFSYVTDNHIGALRPDQLPDAIIIDEVQFAKQRTEEHQSKRREQLEKLITIAGEQNPSLMVLGMSGTPILNNLYEGRKLIELIFSEKRLDLKTDSNVHNAMRMHQEFLRLGIRQKGDSWEYRIEHHDVNADDYLDELREVKRQRRDNMAAYDRVLVQPKIQKVVELAKERATVIYTEFIDGIVEPVRQALLNEGLRVSVFTGENKEGLYAGGKTGLQEFKDGDSDVLICSNKCGGVGVNGLQFRCHQLVFLSLPWTWGDLDQIIARLARNGQLHTVLVHNIRTSLDYVDRKGTYQTWSFCGWRWSVVESKKALADAAVDGICTWQRRPY